jgi:hypothetical protein
MKRVCSVRLPQLDCLLVLLDYDLADLVSFLDYTFMAYALVVAVLLVFLISAILTLRVLARLPQPAV